MRHNERLLRSATDEVPLSALRVVGVCTRCYPERPELADVEIRLVSPRGLVHEGRDYGMTECGRDATGPGWWWAL